MRFFLTIIKFSWNFVGKKCKQMNLINKKTIFLSTNLTPYPLNVEIENGSFVKY